MDKFSEIQTFVNVVETGSLSAAADRMAVAKSAVSRRLAELESRLGVQLLQRTTRRIKLTDSGRRFHESSRRILADLEESEFAIATEHATLNGVIRIAAPLSFGIHHLSPVLNNFQKAHPRVDLDLSLDDRQINLLEAGFDLGLRIGKLEDSSLIARRLAPIRRIVLASPTYLQQHGEPRSPEDLKQHIGLTYTNMPEGQLWQFTRPDGSLVSVRVPGHLKANNGEFLLNAAIDDLGVVVSTTFIACKAIEQGLLKPILCEFEPKPVSLYVIYPSQRHLPHRVRTLIDFLAECFCENPYWDIFTPPSPST
jgi:DNA-binding transcriptional LysR family regulator